jgi:hypothetical protein
MAKLTIDIGTSPNKGDGDPIRTAFQKINSNFNELYAGGFADPASTASNIIPSDDATYDLGSPTHAWADLHVADFIYLNGARLEVTPGGALLVNGGAPAEVQDVQGSVFGDDSTTLVDGVNNVINLDGTISGDVVPDANEAYDLGSATHRFRDLYLSGSTLNLGGTTLSIVGGNLQVGGTDIKDVVTAAGVDYSEIQNTPTAVSELINDAGYITLAEVTGEITVNPTGDLQGSVFADDSTLLVDGVNGVIPYGVLDGAPTALSDFTNDLDYAAIVATQIQTNGLPIGTEASGLFASDGQSLALGYKDLNGTAWSHISLSESNNIQIQADVTVSAATTFDFNDATVTGLNVVSQGLTYFAPIGVGPTQVGLDADIFDFGTGNTVDLQGNSVLFDGATVQNFAPGSVIAKNGQYLYIISAHDGGSTTNAAFIYDTDISNVRQTFYGKTEFGNNGQAPVVDFTGATVTGLSLSGTVTNDVQNSTTISNNIEIYNEVKFGAQLGDDRPKIAMAGIRENDLSIISGYNAEQDDSGNVVINADDQGSSSGSVRLANSSGGLTLSRIGGSTDIYGGVEFNNGTTQFQSGNSVDFNCDVDFNDVVKFAKTTSTGGANSGTAIALDVTKTLQVLNSADGDDDWWSLADGTEGQIMHFVPGAGAGTNQHKVTIANWRRWDSGAGDAGEWVVETNLDWLPFKLDFDGNRWTGVATAIFTDGAWQTNNPWID